MLNEMMMRIQSVKDKFKAEEFRYQPNPQYSSGYDSRAIEEIDFLKSLISDVGKDKINPPIYSNAFTHEIGVGDVYWMEIKLGSVPVMVEVAVVSTSPPEKDYGVVLVASNNVMVCVRRHELLLRKGIRLPSLPCCNQSEEKLR